MPSDNGIDDPDASVELARVLLEAKRYGECQGIDQAGPATRSPTHVAAQFLAGQLAELRRKDDEALAIFYRVLGSNPSDVEAMMHVADVLLGMESHEPGPRRCCGQLSNRTAFTTPELARTIGTWVGVLAANTAGPNLRPNLPRRPICVPT